MSDWICENFSPSTKSTDVEDKMPLYAHHGVQFAWLVDPKTTYARGICARRCQLEVVRHFPQWTPLSPSRRLKNSDSSCGTMELISRVLRAGSS